MLRICMSILQRWIVVVWLFLALPILIGNNLDMSKLIVQLLLEVYQQLQFWFQKVECMVEVLWQC